MFFNDLIHLLTLIYPFAVGYLVDPMLRKHHFGFIGGIDGVTQIRFTTEIPVYKPGVREYRERLLRHSPTTARKIIINAPFEA